MGSCLSSTQNMDLTVKNVKSLSKIETKKKKNNYNDVVIDDDLKYNCSHSCSSGGSGGS